MRVLQLGKHYPPFRGGMETHLQLLCEELNRSVELDVLVCNSRPQRESETIQGVRVTRCPQIAHVASSPICPTLPLEIARRDYDVLHVHLPHPIAALSYLALPQRRPHALVVTYHADIVRQRRLLVAFRPILRMLLERADAIVCATPTYRDSSIELEGFHHKTRVIPFGLDLDAYDATPSLERAASALRDRLAHPGLVLAVGRLVPYKGFDFLVRAMKTVPARLVIVGTGPLREPLERLARETGVSDRVVFAGHVDEASLRAHYRACDVFALPSIDRSEAFALVQLEAMAMGRPVVNTAIPGSGVGWVCRDGESAITVPPRDADALATALRRVLAEPQLAAGLGAAGRARVEREFTTRVMADRTLALYGEVAPGRRAGARQSDCAPIDSYRNP